MLPTGTPVRLLGVFAGLAAFCEALSFFAAALYAFEQTRSTLAVALVMTAVTVAETGGALLGGTLADRVPRKRLAVLASIAAALLLAVLVLGANVIVLASVLVVATVLASPIRPVVGAALPNLVHDGELESANGYVQSVRNAAVTLAPVVAGVGVGYVGARGIFLIAASSLLVAAVVLALVRGSFSAVPSADQAPVSASPFEGFTLLFRDRVLATVVAAGAFSVLVAACGMIADLPFALNDLDIGETGYGVLVATWGAGMTVGSLSAPLILRRWPASRVFAVGLVIEGLGIVAAAAMPQIAAVFIAFLIGGAAGGWGAVADQLLVQERVPDAVRGRVRASNDALIAASYSISLGLGGFVVAVLGARGTYALAGIGCLIAGIAASLVLRRVAALPAAQTQGY